MAAASRFVEISKEFFDNLLDNSIPGKTKRTTKYGMKIFNGKFCCCCFVLLDKTRIKLPSLLLFKVAKVSLAVLPRSCAEHLTS